MERYTWVRFAGRLTPCHTQIWKWSANQWGNGTLYMGSIRGKAHFLPDNAHSNCQHFSGAMEHFIICGFDWHKNSRRHAKTTELGVSNSVGRWMKAQGKLKMQANRIAHSVRIHVGVGQRCRAGDVEPPALPAERTSAGNDSLGRWIKVQAETVQRCKQT